MITRLFQGIARSLFIVGVCFAAVAGMAFYAAWRCLRAAFSRQPGMPVRDATFNVMMAVAALAGVLREQSLRRQRAERQAAPAEGVFPVSVEDLTAAGIVGGLEPEDFAPGPVA